MAPNAIEGDGFGGRSYFSSSHPLAITVLASSRAVISGRLTEATIVISTNTGKITSIFHSVLPREDFPPGTPYVDHSPKILLPGLVDAHVHLNEPGRTEWEGFWTGTRAAAFGGVTTVVDMPLNAIPPTTTLAGLKEKIAAAQGQCWVDVGFYGGIVPGNEGELKPLVRAGVRGFKGFLIDSGVEEFPAVSSEDIRKVFTELADEPTTCMFHAEMIPPIAASVGDDVQHSLPPLAPTGPLDAYQTFLDSRPPSFETYAIAEIVSLAPLAPKLPLHIVHLSSVEAIPLLRDARNQGTKITAETCFHYLSLAAESVKAGDTRHKCCPPIRERSNQDGLWAEMTRKDDPVIKTVVSDHSPCTPDLKLLPQHLVTGKSYQQGDGDFFAAWGGISSVGLGLSILWTEAQRRGITVEDVVRWCCKNTAKQVGLANRKGDIGVGFDGDIAVFDDQAEFTVEPCTMLFRNKCSPYEGKTMKGVVSETWVRGNKVYSRADGFDEKMGPTGKLLLEPRKTKLRQSLNMEVQIPVADPKATIFPVAAGKIQSTFGSTSIDLISKPLGSRILSFSDEWFAAADNLITPTPPIRKQAVYTHAGAWYDGWETRRHNPEAFDWVVIRLGVASGRVKGVEIDTAFFDGNHAPEIAVEGCFSDRDEDVKAKEFEGWETILEKQECGPSRRQAWLLPQITEKAYTHVRLLMYPDGGIARFRLYGVAVPVFPQDVDDVFDLAATVNGGVAASCSDQHFGTKDNLLLPGRGVDMGDGWETKRSRGEHVDWVIVRLGARGLIDKIVVDTAHFRGNYPQKIQIFATDANTDPKADDAGWIEILPPQKTGPDQEHEYSSSQLRRVRESPYQYTKLVMIPDGGIKRFRVFGRRRVNERTASRTVGDAA